MPNLGPLRFTFLIALFLGMLLSEKAEEKLED
jgi:hypothetical protein